MRPTLAAPRTFSSPLPATSGDIGPQPSVLVPLVAIARAAAEFADASRIANPLSRHLREDKIVELVDPWIHRAFSVSNLRDTRQAMADAQQDAGRAVSCC
jgi:hypothetical protein